MTTRTNATMPAVLALLSALAATRSASAQTGLEASDPSDSFTTATPNPYVRFWLRNPTQSAINFAVVSVELTAPVRAAMPVHDVVTERGGRARPLSIAPGARVLVMVFLNDPTMVLRRVSTAATYSVVFEAQRARATLSLTVRRATRRRTLR
jgi:hypothetical protein